MASHDIKSLVWMVITAALLVVVIAFGTIFTNSALLASDATCSSAVIARAGTTTLDLQQAALTACETERVRIDADASEQETRRALIDGYQRCKAQFAGALDRDILDDSDTQTFCHVCGIYSKQGGGGISGVAEELNRAQGFTPTDETPEIGDFVNTHSSPGEMRLDAPIGIVFFQEKEVDFSFINYFINGPADASAAGGALSVAVAATGPLGWFGGAVLVGAGTVGGYVAGHFISPESDTTSGIVISPYDEELVRRMGCTTAQ